MQGPYERRSGQQRQGVHEQKHGNVCSSKEMCKLRGLHKCHHGMRGWPHLGGRGCVCEPGKGPGRVHKCAPRHSVGKGCKYGPGHSSMGVRVMNINVDRSPKVKGTAAAAGGDVREGNYYKGGDCLEGVSLVLQY